MRTDGKGKKGDKTMNSYPVRGIIEQAKTGLLSIEAATDVINIYIETSRKKGYSEGELDTLKSRSEVTGGRVRGEEVQTHTSIPAEEIEFPRYRLSVEGLK